MDTFTIILIILVIILFIFIFLKINEKSLFNKTITNKEPNMDKSKTHEIPEGTKYEQKIKLPEGWDITLMTTPQLPLPSFIVGGIDMNI